MNKFQFWQWYSLIKERLARIEQELQAEDEKRDMEVRYKAEQIENAELRRHATVNDSQIVDEMFGFIDAQVDLNPAESTEPTAFKVRLKGALIEIR